MKSTDPADFCPHGKQNDKILYTNSTVGGDMMKAETIIDKIGRVDIDTYEEFSLPHGEHIFLAKELSYTEKCKECEKLGYAYDYLQRFASPDKNKVEAINCTEYDNNVNLRGTVVVDRNGRVRLIRWALD